MNGKIMIVEDDEMIRNLIALYLNKAGYDVVTARDGEEAKAVYISSSPCFIVLDLMLPKCSGEQYCHWLRHDQQSEVPIIVLSAKSDTTDKVKVLQMGADGYMTKPFDPEELVAQIAAILRRTGHICQKITYHGLTIKPNRREVWLLGQQINLTHHEFQLLYYFMQYPQIVMTRERLIEELYPQQEQIIADRTIDAHIKKLRKKIEENPAKPTRIITVRGMGYKFVT